MIDWSNERSTQNLCGYCTGSPPSANCDGTCFRENYTNYKQNRKKHIEHQLHVIPIRIKTLQLILQKFEDEYDKYSDIGLFESS